MFHHARRLMAILVMLALVLVSVVPALAIGPTAADQAGPTIRPDRIRGADDLKHPTLDSTLVKITQDVKAARQSHEAIARQAHISRGATVSVSIHVDADPATVVDWLDGQGVVVDRSGERLIETFVPVTLLESLASQSGVVAVRSTMRPFPQVMSQGVALHGVPNWSTYGYTGFGVKVGVIDVGFQGITSLIGSELPEVVGRCYPVAGQPTTSLSACDRVSVHGSAVTETVIDVAPDATLYVSNPATWLQLNETVQWMVDEGVTVINHSVGWGWEGPGDGTAIYSDSPLTAVDRAVGGGIIWVNAAGNEAQSTWTGPFRDANDDDVMEFGTNIDVNGVPGYAGQSIDVMMRWDDSWTQAATDLDLFLLDGFGNILASSQEQQDGSVGDSPLEYVSYTPSTTGYLYIAVHYYNGPVPAWVQVQEFNGLPLERAVAQYSIANPAESANPGLLAVGAASWSTPGVIEKFSSQGPTRDGRIKPDVVGIDRADTVSYGPNGFPGTSQASPHVAGLATLIRQRFPEMSPAAIADYVRQHATQAEAPNNVWGYGLAYLPEIAEGEHPFPSIGSISPRSVQPYSTPQAIIVHGSGFVEDSVVRWNGEDRPTTYVSATELTFEPTEQDTTKTGTVQITVYNPPPGGGVSNTVTLTVGDNTPLPADHPEFYRTWQRTDDPVKQLVLRRTWMWGDGPATGAMIEEYASDAGDYRSVKYFDKSRMEVNDPNADSTSPWFVTNGLLSWELITGMLQLGDTTFEERDPAEVPVAGDPDDANGPTYATFNTVLDAEPHAEDAIITQRLDRDGNLTDDPELALYGVYAAELVDVPNLRHRVASPFWEFMNSTGMIYEDGLYYEDLLFENPYYATGYPITEAYWATVKVGGDERDVLVQCFERRCLTYTPDNPWGWQVEAGNVGLHYFYWRYQITP